MARTRTTTTQKPGIMSRLRGRKATKVTTTSTSTNPITGTHTTTQTTKTHGHATNTHHHHNNMNTATGHHHQRKPSMGDKVSGAMMKLRGSLLRKPGLKAAGTRRMHGTDGRGSHRVY